MFLAMFDLCNYDSLMFSYVYIHSLPSSTVRPQPPPAVRSATCAGNGCVAELEAEADELARPRSRRRDRRPHPGRARRVPAGPTGCGQAAGATVRLRLLGGVDAGRGGSVTSATDWLLLGRRRTTSWCRCACGGRYRGVGPPPRRGPTTRCRTTWTAAWRVLARDRAAVRVARVDGSDGAWRAGPGRRRFRRARSSGCAGPAGTRRWLRGTPCSCPPGRHGRVRPAGAGRARLSDAAEWRSVAVPGCPTRQRCATRRAAGSPRRST